MAIKSGPCHGGNWGSKYTIYMEYILNSQNIANNKSNITLRQWAQAPSSNYQAWSGATNNPYHIAINGSNKVSSTKSMDFRNMKKVTLGSWTGDVEHNSEGKLTLNISGGFSIYGPTSLGGGAISFSWTLPTIPRASTINSFSFAGALQPGSANTVQLSLTRASTSFTHDIELRYGGTAIAVWNGQGIPTSLNFPASFVDDLLSRMSSVTSGTVTLSVQTKSGTSKIGSVVSRNATVTVASTVLPTINDFHTLKIAGDGFDKDINKYVQNISKAEVSFSSSARGGAGVRTRNITVDGKTYNGYSIVSDLLTKKGSISVKVEITDTRGRKASQTENITVHEYSSPRITTFTAKRKVGTPAVVEVIRKGSWSSLGTDNPTYATVEVKEGQGSWSEVDMDVSTSGTLDKTLDVSNIAVENSYTFRFKIIDGFNNQAVAIVTVSTEKILFGWHQDKGVGIGKFHEYGGLDIGEETVWKNPSTGKFTTIKPSGDVAFATGSPDWANTTGAEMQIFHDGDIVGQLFTSQGRASVYVGPGQTTKLKLPRFGVVLISASQGGSHDGIGGLWFVMLGGHENGNDYSHVHKLTPSIGSNLQVTTTNENDGYTTVNVKNTQSSGATYLQYLRIL